jgi:hypothetical protein
MEQLCELALTHKLFWGRKVPVHILWSEVWSQSLLKGEAFLIGGTAKTVMALNRPVARLNKRIQPAPEENIVQIAIVHQQGDTVIGESILGGHASDDMVLHKGKHRVQPRPSYDNHQLLPTAVNALRAQEAQRSDRTSHQNLGSKWLPINPAC